MDLIRSLNLRLDELYNNRTSILMEYNLSPFKNGYGVSLDKSVPGQMTISSESQAFSNLSQVDLSSPSINTANAIFLSLGTSNTYYKHYRPISIGNQNPATWNLSADQEIRINDSLIAWKKGQTFRLVIDTQIITNGNSIYIKTDANNYANNTSSYGELIETLTASDFPISFGRTGRPIIEITCTDPVNFKFQVDKIIR